MGSSICEVVYKQDSTREFKKLQKIYEMKR